MLAITGATKLYYVSGFTDMRYGKYALANVVRYHLHRNPTFIETCKMCGVSTLEYFKELFKAIMEGRTDYERSSSARLLPTGRKNMLPMTIGIKK